MGTTIEQHELRNFSLDSRLSEREFSTYVDYVRHSSRGCFQDLVSLLSVSHPVFSGRSTASVTRMRAYVLASFHDIGLPDAAIPYAVEVLETSVKPALVGAAARALRGVTDPRSDFATHLVRSIYNIWQIDQPVNFARYEVTWPLVPLRTALTEVFDTLVWLGRHAVAVLPRLECLISDFGGRFNPRNRIALEHCIDRLRTTKETPPKTCCSSVRQVDVANLDEAKELDIGDVLLEDQDSKTLTWNQFFVGKPSVVVFFYATCQNPLKCVQTIYNLIEIHRLTNEDGLGGLTRFAAITYDPLRDSAARLKRYGNSKGVEFDEDCKFFRVPENFIRIVENFDLGVNYVSSDVNDHQIELYVLDPFGNLVARHIRLQANPRTVVDTLQKLIKSSD